MRGGMYIEISLPLSTRNRVGSENFYLPAAMSGVITSIPPM